MFGNPAESLGICLIDAQSFLHSIFRVKSCNRSRSSDFAKRSNRWCGVFDLDLTGLSTRQESAA
jgi:hypothetical protein